MRATVLTVQTLTEPGHKTTSHEIVIAKGRARSTDELDEWRLYDLDRNTVTFVDDLARTVRTVGVADAATARRAAVAAPVPDGMPRATFAETNVSKPLQGIIARQSVVKLGGYQRELWIANHPLIPPRLFAAMQATQPATTPLAPVMRAADEALLDVKGFPLADHAELPYGNSRLIVHSAVTKIEQRDVPQALLTIPPGYKDVTAPPASRRPVS
jgi:hypothetical protein